jgi:hypothetical protein
MLNVLELQTNENYGLDSPSEKSDQMEAFARVLMGLSHPLQLIGQAREIEVHPTWPQPPRLERKWYAVLDDPDGWRTRTLRKSLEGVGLRCTDSYPVSPPTYEPHEIQADGVVDWPGWVASLVLRRWPREVAPGWLGNALSGDLPVDVALHIMPQDSAWIARKLKMQQTRHSDSDDAGDMLTHRDARRVREDLIAHKDRPVKVAVVFTVRASSPEILASRVETVRHEIGLALGDARPVTWEHDLGLEATSATGICRLRGAWHTLDCNSVASTWIYQPATVNHTNGAPLGTTHTGSMEVRLDPFDESLESFGGIVLAKVGAGKSYLLKLIARRLEGVEVRIVEQRTPAEYAGIPGAHTFNLADVPYEDRARRLRDYVSELWATAKRDPRPRLLILDELWSLLRDPALALLIEEIARIGRHHYLSLWIASQQVQELLASDQGKAVLNNSAIKVYLKQTGPDGDLLAETVRLSTDARRFLRSAARGQALLDVSGMIVPVDVQASAEEHEVITTDPRERRAPLARDTEMMGSRAALVPNGSLS